MLFIIVHIILTEVFVGERLEYKIECECRKPKPGMLIKAAKRF